MYVCAHVVSAHEDACPSDAQGDKPLTGSSAQRKELWQHVSNAGYMYFYCLYWHGCIYINCELSRSTDSLHLGQI